MHSILSIKSLTTFWRKKTSFVKIMDAFNETKL